MTDTPDTPKPGTAKATRKVRDDIRAFKHAVEDADVVVVGKDHDYRPDSPRLREQFPDDTDD